jgi:hypothetical protein
MAASLTISTYSRFNDHLVLIDQFGNGHNSQFIKTYHFPTLNYSKNLPLALLLE